MLGQQMQTVFTRVFVMMIINFYFLVYSIAGLIIFGMGPALRAVSELYDEAGLDYRKYSFKKGWSYFKMNFISANIHFWIFAALLGFLSYNFYLALQIKLAWMIIVEFFIIAAIILIYSIGVFTLMTLTRYDITFKNALKLSVMQFFSNFSRLLLFVVINVALVFATANWMGIILFLSFGLFVMLNMWVSRKWFVTVDEMLDKQTRPKR